MYIFQLKEPEVDRDKVYIEELIKQKVNEIYGTTLATRVLAVIGLIFLLSLLSVAIVRIFVAVHLI